MMRFLTPVIDGVSALCLYVSTGKSDAMIGDEDISAMFRWHNCINTSTDDMSTCSGDISWHCSDFSNEWW